MTMLQSIGNAGNAALESVTSVEYSRHAQTLVGGVASTASAVATAAYTALENVSLSVADNQPTSDAYSIGLGVVLVATGAYLFQGSHKAAAIAGIILGVSAGVIAGSATVAITVGLGAVGVVRVAERALDYLVTRRADQALVTSRATVVTHLATIGARDVTIVARDATIQELNGQIHVLQAQVPPPAAAVVNGEASSTYAGQASAAVVGLWDNFNTWRAGPVEENGAAVPPADGSPVPGAGGLDAGHVRFVSSDDEDEGKTGD